MPRSRSMSIQSDTVPPRPPLPNTAPARVRTLACSARASVSVDLPASGWLMTANDRRLLACRTDSGTTLRVVAETALFVLIKLYSFGLHSSKLILRVQTPTPDIEGVDPAESVMPRC